MSRAERDRRYRLKNREKVAAYQSKWRDDNQQHLKDRGDKRRLEKRGMCLVAAARARARRKNICFDLDGSIAEIQAIIDLGICQVTGVEFDLSPGRGARSPSLDRVVPELGYVPGNVRVVCHALNAAMGDWGEDVTRAIMQQWISA